jgi:predicted 3-demethylubiquinone-9 3-methyltransferase (glyoxalase superfamily)
MSTITTYFLFNGTTEEAINYYLSIFENSKLIKMSKLENNRVSTATFEINGVTFGAGDSMGPIETKFVPVSLFVNCQTEKELISLHKALSIGGQEFMPLDKYDFAEKFAWVSDKFGVQWQLCFNKHV